MFFLNATNSFIIKQKPYFSCTLFFGLILFIKLLITVFAIYVYAAFSPFWDAERYLHASPKEWTLSLFLNRTLFTDFIYSWLKRLFIFDIAVHLVISLFLSYILWFVFKPTYKFINKTLLAGAILLPHFLIWTGVVGKEALAICGFLLLIKSCVDIVVGNKVNFIITIIGLGLSLVIRPHYSLAYLYLFSITILFYKIKFKALNYFSLQQSFMVLAFFLLYFLIIGIYFCDYYSYYLLKFMYKAQSYYSWTVLSNTNRWDIEWNNVGDFVYNLWWGLPTSIIGPTLFETIERPIMIPAFIEGCVSLVLFVFILIKTMYFAVKNPKYISIIIWGLIPALIIGLIINYPFGIFNPGSAIRYKQSLAPLLYFYPLLLMSAARKKKYIEEHSMKPCSMVLT